MSNPTLPSAGGQRAETVVQDGRTDGTKVDVHRIPPGGASDISQIHALINEILRMSNSGRMSYGFRSVREGGRVVWRFVSVPAVTTQRSRLELVIAYMRETRQLGRWDVMDGCPAAGNSASLHHKARQELAATGEIVKEGAFWVWADTLDPLER